MPAQSVELQPRDVASDLPGSLAKDGAKQPLPQVVRMSSGAAIGLGLARLGTDCLQRMVSGPELLLASPRAWLKNAADRRVALIEAPVGSLDELWCCKESLSRRPWVRIISKFSSLRAWNAFRQGLLLRQAGISTPQPLAVVTVTRGGVHYEYLLIESVAGAMSLHSWLTDRSPGDNPDDFMLQRRSVARQLGLQLQRLHQQRFDHRDLKAHNILLSEIGRVWLIDLDGIWRWPLLPRIRRVQNLARLWAAVALTGQVTATEALRFLFAYLTPEQRNKWKSLWRRVARQALKKIGRQKRRKNIEPIDGGLVTG